MNIYVLVSILFIVWLTIYVIKEQINIKGEERRRKNKERIESIESQIEMRLVKYEWCKTYEKFRLNAHDLADKQYWKTLDTKFVDICHILHKMRWKCYGVSRLNFAKRMRKYWYIKAINREPLLRGKYNKWK
jgi:hypothetical protein